MKELIWEQERVDAWMGVDGNNTFRLNHDLNEDSVFFDVGAYTGDTTARMWERHRCNIYAFEPIPKYFVQLYERFKNNPKIRTYPFGLSFESYPTMMSADDYASSVYADNRDTLVSMVSISRFMMEECIERVHLAEFNIEGAEYDLLDYMTKWPGIINKFDNLQIQFHDIPNQHSAWRMQCVWEELEKTHELTYQYIYCFENWRKKDA